mgnify:FL=1
MKAGKRKILFVVILLLAFAARIYVDNNLLEISRYKVTSNKIPDSFDGFKILQLSDLHSKSFGDGNIKLMEKINGENPDIVVMTGDMVDSKDTDFDVFTDLAGEISKNYDTYYILGNHEQSLSKKRRKMLTDTLTEFGVKVLDNEKVTITKGEDII